MLLLFIFCRSSPLIISCQNFQSAYRKFHSYETALLDLFAVFDTTDYNILLNRLKHWFGVSSTALNLLSSFLSGRFLIFVTSNVKSQSNYSLEYGVPQVSVLRPLLHSLYTTPLLSAISNHPCIQSHFYKGDKKSHLSFFPELTSSAFSTIESCLRDVFLWMTSNKLSVNPNKTEYLQFNPNNLNLAVDIFTIGLNAISRSNSAKNLSLIF